MSGHDFLLGEKEGKLFRGDLCYQQEKIRWTQDSIDDVINEVTEWNYEMLKQAQAEMEIRETLLILQTRKRVQIRLQRTMRYWISCLTVQSME